MCAQHDHHGITTFFNEKLKDFPMLCIRKSFCSCYNSLQKKCAVLIMFFMRHGLVVALVEINIESAPASMISRACLSRRIPLPPLICLLKPFSRNCLIYAATIGTISGPENVPPPNFFNGDSYLIPPAQLRVSHLRHQSIPLHPAEILSDKQTPSHAG